MSAFIVSKTFTFPASHQLSGLWEGHPCGRLHGHTYQVWLDLAAERLDGSGFAFDFHKLDPFQRYIELRFDHRHLNEMLAGNPTAERIAEHLYAAAERMFDQPVHAVTVWQDATCSARYQP
jgi:6-pyruvoyltetrahydropterin/6-carboxytetrahydropterin synthase